MANKSKAKYTFWLCTRENAHAQEQSLIKALHLLLDKINYVLKTVLNLMT